MSCLGTAMRWVSRYSESRMMRDGSTIAVKDLLERLPLKGCVSYASFGAAWK